MEVRVKRQFKFSEAADAAERELQMFHKGEFDAGEALVALTKAAQKLVAMQAAILKA